MTFLFRKVHFWYRPFLQTLWGLLKHKCVPLRMFLHNVFEYAEEDDDVQATRDFATLMDHGYINKYISSKSNYISVHLLLSSKFIALRG